MPRLFVKQRNEPSACGYVVNSPNEWSNVNEERRNAPSKNEPL